MWQLFKTTIRDRRLVWLIYVITACGFLLLHISIFPSFKDQQVEFDKILETMPQGVVEAFGLQDYNLSVFENYISAEEFSLIWPLLLIIMAISLAGAAIASEIEKGTIELLISQPISRTNFYVSRYLSGLALLVGFTLITIIFMIGVAKIFAISLQFDRYPAVWLMGTLFGWSIYSIAFLLSSIFSDRGRVYFISAGLVVLMYATNLISNLKDNLDKLKFASFFHYYNPNDLLIRRHIDLAAIIVFASVISVCFLVGLTLFNKRDIST